MNDLSILIVDDVSNMRRLLTSTLRSLDITNTLDATNSLDAIEIYKNKDIDIVFLDLNMPEVDGLEALKQIREHDTKAFVVIVSGENYVGNVKKAIALGAKGFIVKPYKFGKIQETINKFKKLNPDRFN